MCAQTTKQTFDWQTVVDWQIENLPDVAFHIQHNTKCCGMFCLLGPKLSATQWQQSIWTSISAYEEGILSNRTSYRIKPQNTISKRQKKEQNGKRIVANSAKGKSMVLFLFSSVATQRLSTLWSVPDSPPVNLRKKTGSRGAEAGRVGGATARSSRLRGEVRGKKQWLKKS